MTVTFDLHERCLQATLTRLAQITFAGTDDSPGGPRETYDRLVPVDEALLLPCLMVSIEGEQETVQPATNLREDYEFPVRVAILDQNDADFRRRRAKLLTWRHQVARAFVHQRPAGLENEVHLCRVSYGVAVPPDFPSQRYLVSGLTLRFVARLARGIA